MLESNGTSITTKLLGSLGKWIIGGLLTALIGLVVYMWADLSTDNKAASLQMIAIDKKLERINTIQKRVLDDVSDNHKKLIEHLINDKDMTEGDCE